MTTVERVSSSTLHSSVLDDVRLAFVELLGAERRLRSREQSRSHDLTQSQLRALSALSKVDEVTAGELAKSADLNPASVTAMLDQLEANDIIERRRPERDRRVCMVSLTGKGRAILDERQANWLALWQEHFGDMSDEELSAALKVIQKMVWLLDIMQ
ncbi:MAG: MarR family winged helix-turn-helix transcriptional regulator [Acidimicrobiales bacterium]